MELIVKLVDYLNQNSNVDSLSIEGFSESQINIIVTKIVMWIKAEYKRYMWALKGKKNLHKPLELDFKYDWCNDIKNLILNDSRFSKIFTIKNNFVDFNSNLDLKEKDSIIIYVGENLKNVIII